MRRSGPLKRRTRLNPRSEKQRRRDRELALSRAQVRERSEGYCEARGILARAAHDAFNAQRWKQGLPQTERYEILRLALSRCLRWASEAHHVLPRSRGRDDSPANLLDVCRSCHAFVEAQPLLATEIGLIRHRGPDPV